MQALIITVVVLWFCVFMTLGQNIATVLFGAGIVGIILWVGPGVLGGLIGQDVFYTTSSYTLSIVPLYLVMAHFLMRGGVITDLFNVCFRLAGRRRFPLGFATLITGGVLGAVSGSGAASAAALSTLTVPQLERAGYTKRFAVALTAASGSLDPIIPPSLTIIIYGSLTQVSIGHLFIGSFLPGVVCIFAYALYLAAFGEVRPDAQDSRAIEPDAGTSAGSMPAFVFVLILIFVVFGGIYGGVMTAAEAGAIGAFAALVGMVVMRRINLKDIAESLVESAKVTGMLMIIIIGAQIFGRFLSFSRLPRQLVVLAEPLLPYPNLLVGLILVILFIFGMFLEGTAVMVLLVPILLPLITAVKVDPVWFGVLACMTLSLGLLTPPVGMATFAAATASRVPVGPVFAQTFWFALTAFVIAVPLMIAFPGIVTWLPSQIR